MKKIIFVLLFLPMGFAGYSQCKVAEQSLPTTCNALMNLMKCYLTNKKIDKALAVYLAYTHINESNQPPPAVKDYFSRLSDDDLRKLATARLYLRRTVYGPATSSTMTSRGPTTIHMSSSDD